MARMIDDIFAGNMRSMVLVGSDGNIDLTMDIVKQADQRICIDNVIKYYYDDIDNADMTKLSGSVPLFEYCWYEGRIPSVHQESLHLGEVEEFGISISTFDRNHADAEKTTYMHHLLNLKEFEHIPTRWIISCAPFIRLKHDKVSGPYGIFSIMLNDDGVPAQDVAVIPSDIMQHNDEMSAENIANYFIATMIAPMLFANSLLNCQNVSLERVHINEKIKRAYVKRHKRELLDFKEIYIQPIVSRKVYDRQRTNALDRDDISNLSIRRGHFKDYTGKGLFGKYKGRFWWTPQVVQGKVRVYHIDGKESTG